MCTIYANEYNKGVNTVSILTGDIYNIAQSYLQEQYIPGIIFTVRLIKLESSI